MSKHKIQMKSKAQMTKDEKIEGISRRCFLAAGWSSLVLVMAGSAGASIRFFLPNVLFEPSASFRIGKPNDYADNSVNFFPERKIFVIKNEKGVFQAVSAVCTHLRCIVKWSEINKNFECPCHGSIFDGKGRVIGGPAPKPLDWYEITMGDDGRLFIDTIKIVDSGYYLKV